MSFFRKTIGTIAIFISLFCIIAVLDYHPDDPSYLNATHRTVNNITSKYGANIADPIVQAFGYAILIPLLLFIYFGALEILKKSIRMLQFKISVLFLTWIVTSSLSKPVTANSSLYSFSLSFIKL